MNFLTHHQYLLDKDFNPVLVRDEEYYRWLQYRRNNNLGPIQHVQFTRYGPAAIVSTVFLSIPHGEDQQARPILFETLIEGSGIISELGDVVERYATWYAAAAGHDYYCSQMEALHSLPPATHNHGFPVTPWPLPRDLRIDRFEGLEL